LSEPEDIAANLLGLCNAYDFDCQISSLREGMTFFEDQPEVGEGFGFGMQNKSYGYASVMQMPATKAIRQSSIAKTS
jgi:hypothetical protein